MPNEIGPMVLGGLSLIFASYGLWELTIAYKTSAFKDWSERAVPGAGGILLAALFAAMTVHILG